MHPMVIHLHWTEAKPYITEYNDWIHSLNREVFIVTLHVNRIKPNKRLFSNSELANDSFFIVCYLYTCL